MIISLSDPIEKKTCDNSINNRDKAEVTGLLFEIAELKLYNP